MKKLFRASITAMAMLAVAATGALADDDDDDDDKFRIPKTFKALKAAHLDAGARTVGGPGVFDATSGQVGRVWRDDEASTPPAIIETCITVTNFSKSQTINVGDDGNNIINDVDARNSRTYCGKTDFWRLECPDTSCIAVWRVDHRQ